jgi:hypothetical protein
MAVRLRETHPRQSRQRFAHREADWLLLRLGLETGGLGSRRLSDQRERRGRGITPGPLPDGESEEVQERQLPPEVFSFPRYRAIRVRLRSPRW